MLNRNVARTQLSGRNGIIASRNDIVDQAAREGTFPSLHKAIVMDVIINPAELSDEYKQQLSSIVNNSELIEVMPVNSVIARLVSNGQGLINVRDTILFPFFSSHIMLPIQPGELVYVIYEDLANFGDKIGYWLTRPHGQGTVEDVNYTHNDRQFDARNNIGFWSTLQKQDIASCTAPSFPNGGGTSTTQTISSDQDNTNTYNIFAQNSPSSKLITPEPVPRWHKRPQELVLQGANNTLIMMGEDRFGHVSGAVDSVNGNNRIDQKGFSGTIDMIVGRGRMMPKAQNIHNQNEGIASVAASVGPPSNEEPTGTAPRVIQNARGTFETDKAPFRQKRSDGGRVQENKKEGDPDFEIDAARLLISMQTKGDENFGLTDIKYPTNSLNVIQPEASSFSGSENNISGSFNRSYVIQKGDHIRIVARKDPNLNVNGSILLLKEGVSEQEDQLDRGSKTNFDTQEKDLAYIYMTDDGIQIQAKKIYFGPSKDHQEPYVLWSKYAETIDNLQQQIRTVANTQGGSANGIQTALDAIINAIYLIATGPGNVCPVGSPNPALTAIGIGIKAIWDQTSGAANGTAVQTQSATGAASLVEQQIENMNSNVATENHSKIIFGT